MEWFTNSKNATNARFPPVAAQKPCWKTAKCAAITNTLNAFKPSNVQTRIPTTVGNMLLWQYVQNKPNVWTSCTTHAVTPVSIKGSAAQVPRVTAQQLLGVG
eukprot:TRINITY_DN59575_c0_g2_i1.p3 TRINITY_DN59575_c0_g2~~TRINITY_DN59575_c0_g2_i1.p3  ORF type:complete len:102 (+),score=10.85 TRINITY_DN59575_c0_g2_i1:191-496(+)